MKHAIITGAGTGIGKAIATLAAHRGYRVGVFDVDRSAAQTTAESLDGAIALHADVRDEQQVEAALEAFGEAPDLVVNNAGIVRFAPLLEHSLDDFKCAMDINLIGTFVVSKAAAKRMRVKGTGVIINMASVNALHPGEGVGAYPASKAAVIKLSEQMSLEWARFGIRVNTVAPGFIDGGMSTPIYADPEVRRIRGGAVPLGRLGSCEDIAQAVMWLASDSAAYITGQNLTVDGGLINSVIANLPRVSQ